MRSWTLPLLIILCMPMADMNSSLPGWKRFIREAEFGDGHGWRVIEKRVVDELRVTILLQKGDEQRRLVVQDDEPIELVFPDG